MNAILSVAMLLGSVAPAASLPADAALKGGDVWIPVAERVHNQQSCCVWAASQVVVNAAGYQAFHGIFSQAVSKGWHGAGISDVTELLDHAKIPYRATTSHEYAVLYAAQKEGVPFYFQIRGHALVGVGIDAQSVRVLDNNGNLQVKAWPRAEFDERWTGQAFYAHPKVAGPFGLFGPRRVICPGPGCRPFQPQPLVVPVEPPVVTPPVVVVPPDVAPPVVVTPPPVVPKDGKDGRDGKDGAPGTVGPAGPAGAPGQSVDMVALAKIVTDATATKTQPLEIRITQLENQLKQTSGPLRIRIVPAGSQ